MNKDEILEMQAGRELDALIAERVMGWTKVSKTVSRWTEGTEIREKIVWEGKAPDDLKCSSPIEIKKYSTGIAAAWQVVEKIRGMYECKSHNGIVVMSDPDGWYAEFPEPIWSDATEKTAPLAICRAALLATLESDE